MGVADREEALTNWLAARGVDDAWRITPALATAGVDIAWASVPPRYFRAPRSGREWNGDRAPLPWHRCSPR